MTLHPGEAQDLPQRPQPGRPGGLVHAPYTSPCMTPSKEIWENTMLQQMLKCAKGESDPRTPDDRLVVATDIAHIAIECVRQLANSTEDPEVVRSSIQQISHDAAQLSNEYNSFVLDK